MAKPAARPGPKMIKRPKTIGGKMKLAVFLEPAVRERVRRAAAKGGMSASQWIAAAVAATLGN